MNIDANNPLVNIQNIGKSYNSQLVLKNINLTVYEEEFLILLGPSGSGKSTLLHTISGIVQPDHGSIYLRDKDITNLNSSARDLGMVFQNYALIPHMSIYENIAFPLRVRKTKSQEIRTKVPYVSDLLHLSKDLLKKRPHQLSGGQQQRVAIARCLIYNPSLILMDEPLGALDRKLREQIQILLVNLQKELKLAIMFVTHDQDEALILGDRISLMNEGSIEQIDSPINLYKHPRTHFAAQFIGASNIFNTYLKSDSQDIYIEGLDINIKNHDLELTNDHAVVRAMLRPEDIHIVGGDDNYNFTVSITEIYHMGSYIKYKALLNDISIKGRADANNNFSVGDKIRISIDYNKIELIHD